MTLSERKARIQELKGRAKDLQHKAFELAQTCPHKIEVQTDAHGYAHCIGCDSLFGWYCPDSPDHVCHYHAENGMVEQIYGPKVPMLAGYVSEDAYLENCVFCGHPEERK